MNSDGGQSVLVTGAAGYVGRTVCRALYNAGFKVRALTRRASTAFDSPVEVCHGDLMDKSRVRSFLSQCFAVIHSARSDAPTAAERAAADLAMTDALLQSCSGAGVSRFIHLSTIAVYELPAAGVVDESSPYATMSDSYARSKIQIEERIAAEHRLPWLIMQPGCVYGGAGGWWSGALLDMMKRGKLLLPDFGRGTANLVHVDDLAAAVALAVKSNEQHERVIITDGQPVRWLEYYERLQGHLGKQAVIPMSASDCLKMSEALTDRRLPSRLKRWMARSLFGRPMIFPVDASGVQRSISSAIFSNEKAISLLGFTPRQRLAEVYPNRIALNTSGIERVIQP